MSNVKRWIGSAFHAGIHPKERNGAMSDDELVKAYDEEMLGFARSALKSNRVHDRALGYLILKQLTIEKQLWKFEDLEGMVVKIMASKFLKFRFRGLVGLLTLILFAVLAALGVNVDGLLNWLKNQK